MKKAGLILDFVQVCVCTTIICSSAIKIIRILKNREENKKTLPVHIKIYTDEAGEK